MHVYIVYTVVAFVIMSGGCHNCCLHSGCYDGCVYSLVCDSGTTHWCIQPGGSSEPIKSSPCVDPVTGLVWVGSHDHHIYALNIYVSTFRLGI